MRRMLWLLNGVKEAKRCITQSRILSILWRRRMWSLSGSSSPICSAILKTWRLRQASSRRCLGTSACLTVRQLRVLCRCRSRISIFIRILTPSRFSRGDHSRERWRVLSAIYTGRTARRFGGIRAIY